MVRVYNFYRFYYLGISLYVWFDYFSWFDSDFTFFLFCRIFWVQFLGFCFLFCSNTRNWQDFAWKNCFYLIFAYLHNFVVFEIFYIVTHLRSFHINYLWITWFLKNLGLFGKRSHFVAFLPGKPLIIGWFAILCQLLFSNNFQKFQTRSEDLL